MLYLVFYGLKVRPVLLNSVELKFATEDTELLIYEQRWFFGFDSAKSQH